MSKCLLRMKIVLMFGVCAVVMSCSGSGSDSTGDDGPVIVQSVDHPAVGHWVGTITMDGDREVPGTLQVDADVDRPKVAITLIPAGAVYSECSIVEMGENALTFRFDRGKFDNLFTAMLSPDGNELTGSISVPQGSSSAMQTGSFQFVRTPRAPHAPGAMVFSKAMSGRVGSFTLTITLAELNDGRWVGQVDIPEQSMNELPLFNLREQNGTVTGEIQIFGPPMVFEMNLSDDRQRLTGVWKQGGGSTSLDLPRIR